LGLLVSGEGYTGPILQACTKGHLQALLAYSSSI
jgi:hypothetical protein